MSAGTPRPDAGVPSQCTSAATQIEAIAADLANARMTCEVGDGLVGSGQWTGQAAAAFVHTLSAIQRSSADTVSAWSRLAHVMSSYGRALEALQEDGDRLRGDLEQARTSLTAARRRYDRDRDEPARAGAAAAAQIDVGTHTIAVSRAEGALDTLAHDRRALDLDTVAKLHLAPGPGAAAWLAIAYTNGRAVPTSTIIDDLLDLLRADPADNLDLLHQFLQMYSGDEDVMSDFYDELGARGLLDLMRCAEESDPYGAGVLGLLAAGLATATRGWDRPKQEQFGRDLVEAIAPVDAADFPKGSFDSDYVALLLAAPGLAPHVGLGAFQRLEEIRTKEPERFERITPAESGLGGGTLANSVFLLLAQIPADACRYLFSTSHADTTIEYWYGQHPWTADGFAGPAALLHAIISDQSLRAHDRTDPGWAQALSFTGRAIDALGANADFTLTAVSAAASLHLAATLERVIPEITGLLANANARGNDGLVTKALIDGAVVEVLGLAAQKGPLAQVLGIALQDPKALDLFGAGLARHLIGVRDFAVASGDYDSTREPVLGLGNVYGFTHGALAAEFERVARAASQEVQRTIDTLDTFISFIPGASTGKAGVDYAIQVGMGGIPDLVSALVNNPSRDEIEELSRQHRDGGQQTLVSGWDDAMTVSGLDPTLLENLRHLIGEAYHDSSNAASQTNATGSYQARR